MSCGSFAVLMPFRPEDLDPPEREAFQAHLAACPACRARRLKTGEMLCKLAGRHAEIAKPFPGAAPPVLRPAWRHRHWAAAAAAVIAVAVLWPKTVSKPPDLPPAARPEPMEPAPSLGDGRERVLGHGVLASLREGGRMEVRGSSLALKSGALHLDSPGESVSVEAAGAKVTCRDTALSLEVSAPDAGLAWLATAWAAEGELRLAVWRGTATLTFEGREVAVREGQAGVLRGGVWNRDDRLLASAWRPDGWTALAGAFSLRDAVREFPGTSEDGVLEILVRRRDPSAELGLRLPGEDAVYEFPAGSALQEAEEAWVRLRLESRGGWRRAWVGGKAIVSCPAARLGRTGQRAEGAGMGLRAWGGDVEVREVRWRAF